MKIAIAQAYNGLHRTWRKYLQDAGFKTCYFQIDEANWMQNAIKTKADVFLWNADDKGPKCYLIFNRVYFLEKYLGKKFFPDSNMYFIFNDKIKQKNVLDMLEMPMLPTFITYFKDRALEYIKKTKYPFILKDAHGFEGKAVYLVKDKNEAGKIVENIFSEKGFNTIKGHFYAQKFVPNLGRDLRIITIGNKIAAAYWRIASEGNWKTNLGQGGNFSFENVPKEPQKMCLHISKRMKYHWMAYDVFQVGKKFYVCEFSPNFGVKGPRLHGLDIRKMQMEYVSRLLRK